MWKGRARPLEAAASQRAQRESRSTSLRLPAGLGTWCVCVSRTPNDEAALLPIGMSTTRLRIQHITAHPSQERILPAALTAVDTFDSRLVRVRLPNVISPPPHLSSPPSVTVTVRTSSWEHNALVLPICLCSIGPESQASRPPSSGPARPVLTNLWAKCDNARSALKTATTRHKERKPGRAAGELGKIPADATETSQAGWDAAPRNGTAGQEPPSIQRHNQTEEACDSDK